jgi:integrase
MPAEKSDDAYQDGRLNAIADARSRVKEPKQLQFLKDKGIYRISVGRWTNPKTGRTKEKVFSLTKDETYARCLALALRQTWAGMVAIDQFDGVTEPTVWDDTEISSAIHDADMIYGQRLGKPYLEGVGLPPAPEWAPIDPKAAGAAAPESTSKTLVTLRDAVDAYYHHLNASGLAPSNRHRQRDSLENLLRHVSPVTRLSDLTYQKLCDIAKIYRDRPLTKSGEPMKVYSAKTVMQHFRQLLDWLEDAEHWVGPRRWEKAVRFKVSEEITPAERRRLKTAVKTFSPEEIGSLWRACATPLEKSVLMFGLNFAATQQQLSELQVGDHQGDYLHLYRSKTGVEVYYDYWPETAKLMAPWLAAKTDPEARLMTTKNGMPLVHWSASGNKTDNVDDQWKRILNRSGLPDQRKLTFSALRDTTSNAMLKRGGEAVQQQVLAQAPTTVAARHYTEQKTRQDFEAMNKHLMAWWAEEIAPEVGKVSPTPPRMCLPSRRV